MSRMTMALKSLHKSVETYGKTASEIRDIHPEIRIKDLCSIVNQVNAFSKSRNGRNKRTGRKAKKKRRRRHTKRRGRGRKRRLVALSRSLAGVERERHRRDSWKRIRQRKAQREIVVGRIELKRKAAREKIVWRKRLRI